MTVERPGSKSFWRKVTRDRLGSRVDPSHRFYKVRQRRGAAAERAAALVEAGCPSAYAYRLGYAGYGRLEDVRRASDRELLERVRNFGKPSLRALRAELGPPPPWAPPAWMAEE